MKSLSKAIFYIKYYATKHGCVIERKATLDENCFEGHHKKFGYPYKKYIDVWATEEVNNGQPQYRTASKKWEINQTQTLNQWSIVKEQSATNTERKIVFVAQKEARVIKPEEEVIFGMVKDSAEFNSHVKGMKARTIN